jgi:hypothetical protein
MEILYITPELWQTSEISELAKALVLFQKKLTETSIKKDSKNPHLRNEYLSLDHTINLTKPLLCECNLVITQDMAGGFLTTTLMHESGQFKGSAMEFNPMAGNKGTNKLQEIGGGITYAKRYTWSAMLGISVDTDDDGNGMKGKDVAPPKKKTPKKPTSKAAQPKPKVIKDSELDKVVKWAVEKSISLDVVKTYYSLTAKQEAKFKETIQTLIDETKAFEGIQT